MESIRKKKNKWTGDSLMLDLEEGHLRDRGEVVHANDLLGALAGLGDVGDGDGRGVRGKDAVLKKTGEVQSEKQRKVRSMLNKYKMWDQTVSSKSSCTYPWCVLVPVVVQSSVLFVRTNDI